jgi:methionyl-tRNA synthetase
MPKSTVALWQQIGGQTALGAIELQRIDQAGVWGVLPAGTTTNKGESLFPRLVEDEA